MARSSFRKATHPNAPFDFAAEVARAYEDFPQLRRNTYFIDAGTGEIVGRAVSRRKKALILADKNVRKAIGLALKGWSFFIGNYEHRDSVKAIVFHAKTGGIRQYLPDYSAHHDNRSAFDHELYHARFLRSEHQTKVPDRLGEGGAEAFMLMRQFQRYGTHRLIRARALSTQGASHFFLEPSKWSENYFATPILDKVIALKKTFNLAALTPRQTFEKARELARLHTPDDEQVATLRRELKRGRKPLPLKEFSDRILATGSPEAFRWGARVLRFEMGSRFQHRPDSAAFEKRHWPRVRKALKKKERRGSPSPL
jgi:hypothetical protein